MAKNDGSSTYGDSGAAPEGPGSRPSWLEEVGRVGQRIQELVPERELRPFSRKAGIDESSLRAYIAGTSKPGVEALVKIAVAAGVRVDWLAAGRPPKREDAVAREDRSPYGDAIDFFMVPRYDVEAGAGSGRVVEQESEIGRLAFRKDWIKQRGLSAKDLVVIRISGDSMEPTVRHGSLVLVDSSQDKVMQDGIYVLMLDSHLVAKRLQVDFAGGVYVRSDNLAYREQHLTADQAEAIRIVGRVVWVGSEL